MYCTNCGAKLEESAVYCANCGTQTAAPATQTANAGQTVISQPAMSKPTIRLILIGAAAVIIIFVILKFAGGGGSQSSPESTVKSFMNAVKKQDASKMVSYLVPPDGDKSMKSLVDVLDERFEADEINLVEYKIVKVEKDEDTATVDYEVEYLESDGEKATDEDSFDLTKVKGKWYIDSDFLN